MNEKAPDRQEVVVVSVCSTLGGMDEVCCRRSVLKSKSG